MLPGDRGAILLSYFLRGVILLGYLLRGAMPVILMSALGLAFCEPNRVGALSDAGFTIRSHLPYSFLFLRK